MDTPNSTRPLMENNPYPVLDNQPKPQPLAQQPQPNLMNPYAQAPYSQPNQGYSPNQQQYQPNGPINYPNQGQQPYVLNPYPEQRQQQGFQPAPYGQYVPPPPPVQVQVIKLPQYVTQAHPQYRFIVEQANMPCQVCSYRGADFVSMSPGCAAFSWSICLFIFTGILCFWIPFVCDGCKDIKISCSKCRHTKYVIEKPCC